MARGVARIIEKYRHKLLRGRGVPGPLKCEIQTILSLFYNSTTDELEL
jgi:hypothetical protein